MISSLVQALTEFIPVSSSAHLFFLKEPFTRFDYALLHFATSLVVLFYERVTIFHLLLFKDKKLTLNLMMITFISALGLFLLKDILMIFKKVEIIIFLSLLFSFIFYFIFSRKSFFRRDFLQVDYVAITTLSIAQIVGSFSGVSRLGMMTAVFYLLGLNRALSYIYAMILSIPLGIGALGYSFIYDERLFQVKYFFGTLFFGLIFYPFFKKIFIIYGFKPFFYYRIILAFLMIYFML